MPPNLAWTAAISDSALSMFENSCKRSNENSPAQASASSQLPKPDSRRLRASCDGCYLSKVKCTKETPTCVRCSNHSVLCKYSPSQRVGKPRRIREDQQAPGVPKYQGGTAAQTSDPSSTSDVPGLPSLYSWSANFDLEIARRRPEIDLEEEVLMIQQRPFQVTDSSHGSNFSSPSNSLPTPVESIPDFPLTSQKSSAGWERAGESASLQKPASLFSTEGMTLQDDFPQLYFPSIHDLLATSSNTSLPESCFCASTAFAVLRSLHEQSSNTPFDKVLAANKSAVCTIATILSCTCTRDSTSIMTLAVALTKILSRYQSIGRPSLQSATTDANTTDVFVAAPLSTPITLGAYKLEGAEEEQIKLQVILSELRKVDGLIGRFQVRFCAGPVKHEARVYGELVTFLRRRLRDIVESLQRDIHALYEANSY